MTQLAVFPMRGSVWITQNENYIFSHNGVRALDLDGMGSTHQIFAPFDCVCVNAHPSTASYIYESLEPVLYADGSVDYAWFSIVHDCNSSNHFVGRQVAKGQVVGNEGVCPLLANGNGSVGEHLHLEQGRGKWTGGTGSPWFNNGRNSIANGSGVTWQLIGSNLSCYELYSLFDNTLNRVNVSLVPAFHNTHNNYPWLTYSNHEDGTGILPRPPNRNESDVIKLSITDVNDLGF